MKRRKRTSKQVGATCLMYRDPKEIIRDEALAHLPAKTLVRCSLVCKEWKYLISSPFFVHTHSNLSRSAAGLFSFFELMDFSAAKPGPRMRTITSATPLPCSTESSPNTKGIMEKILASYSSTNQPLFDFVPNYKIVCAFHSADFEGAHEFQMYSSESGTWKLCKEICFGRHALQPKSGVHVNGVVYWQAGPGTLFAFDHIKDRSQLIPDNRFD